MKTSDPGKTVEQLKAEIESMSEGYLPLGHISPKAFVVLSLSTILISSVTFVVCRFICKIFYGIVAGAVPSNLEQARQLGFGVIVVNLLLFVAIIRIPHDLFGLVRSIAKLRNVEPASTFAFFGTLIVSLALYLPLNNGFSLAPTDLAIFGISIRWPLMAAACVIPPFLVKKIVFAIFFEMRYLEKKVPWEEAKKLLEAIKARDYDWVSVCPSDLTASKVAYAAVMLIEASGKSLIEVEARYRADCEPSTKWLLYRESLSWWEVNGFEKAMKSQAGPSKR